MPYIPINRRIEIDRMAEELYLHDQKPGELCYLFTKLLLKHIFSSRFDINYQRFCAAVGILETCKQELYRRYIAPREDKKMEEHGDVY